LEAIEMTDAEMNSLTEAIYKRHGVDFTCYEPKSLKRRLSRVLHVYKLSSSAELWMKILREPSFIHEMINELTVGLTSMFRDPTLWKHLRDKILPEFKNKPQLKIWHAGCSTGEELYTMGIVLEDTGLLQKASSLASDINTKFMDEAKEGKYHKIKTVDYEQKFKEYNPHGTFQRYYTTNGNETHFDKKYIKHVDFKSHNLVTEKMNQKFDIIFCRNVMIYFDHATKIKLLNQFHECLNPGGYFIIGFFDSIMPLIDKEMYSFENLDLRIFRKPVSKFVPQAY
jgi:chemotaxis protein methyltransferase CheR